MLPLGPETPLIAGKTDLGPQSSRHIIKSYARSPVPSRPPQASRWLKELCYYGLTARI